jgi:hypothetical protein
MKREKRDGDTPIIFLAMFWGGGGPFTIAEIVALFDWVFRAIPNRADMESGLNTLLAMGLIEKHNDTFLIPESHYHRFDAFRKKRRKDRFDVVRLYFRQFSRIHAPPKVISLTEEQYEAHIREYATAFAEASRRFSTDGNRRTGLR